MKAKVELTAEAVRKAIEDGKPTSMAGLAHALGYEGNVSSWLAKRIRSLVPEVDAMLKHASASGKPQTDGKPTGTDVKAAKPEAKTARKAAPEARKPAGKWARDSRNPFREGSAYATCFDVMAAHKEGLTRAKLVELLAKATGKDEKHAGYDVQVLLSAKANEDGLSNNDSPRHRSCRPGFWVKRTNDHVTLVVD